MSGLFLTEKEARLFLLCVGLGAGAGVLYDLLTLAYRGLGRGGKAVGEGLFALFAGFSVFSLLKKSETALRSYTVLGLCVGWFLYAATLSFFLRGIFSKKRVKLRENRDADG